MTFSADELFIPHKVISAGITNPGKKNSEQIVAKVIQVIHAAG